jgi:hypothetical protein
MLAHGAQEELVRADALRHHLDLEGWFVHDPANLESHPLARSALERA